MKLGLVCRPFSFHGGVETATAGMVNALVRHGRHQVHLLTTAGQFPAPGGDEWGLLLEKDSKLTDCVNQAVKKLADAGDLKRLQDQYMGGEAAPELH